MKGIGVNIAVATAFFAVITLLWQGDVLDTVFSAVAFAMTYGAYQVAVMIFRGGSE